MSLSFLTPSRTVLMISDEALFIYSVTARNIKFIEAVPWSVDNFEENVAVIISKDCAGKPVLILNDMVEQYYRKEKVPYVGALDKFNVLKRKLEVAFPNYPVRAALPLREKVSKTSSALPGRLYIFAAIPMTEAFEKTMEAARRSLASIAGFCLLPVESSDMIKLLADQLVPKTDQKAQWTIFMGQHQNGGLRQIVIRNGELALTRMTPIVENDDDPVLWAKDVHQEFQSTMSYLSRFGFQPSDGLNVILISEPLAGSTVDGLMETPCNFYPLTSVEAGRLLKSPIGTQDVGYHADIIHAAWIARKRRFVLPMKAQQIEGVSQPRRIAAFVSVILFLAVLFQGYQLTRYIQNIRTITHDIETVTQRKEQVSLYYRREVKRKEDLGYNIKLIQSSLALYGIFEKTRIDILPLFYNIGVALGRDMRIDRLDVSRGGGQVLQKLLSGDKNLPLFIANMQMTFPSTTNIEKGNAEVETLRARLQNILPDHIVRIEKLLEDYEYSEAIVVETGDVARAVSSQDYIAEISIEGGVK